jgi:hypothetical protein
MASSIAAGRRSPGVYSVSSLAATVRASVQSGSSACSPSSCSARYTWAMAGSNAAWTPALTMVSQASAR